MGIVDEFSATVPARMDNMLVRQGFRGLAAIYARVLGAFITISSEQLGIPQSNFPQS